MKKILAVLFLSALSLAQATPPFALAPVVRQQFFDTNGKPLSGGFVYTYQAGTSNPLATYVDASGVAQNTNPIALDSGGFASIWLGAQAYKFVVTDSQNVQQYAIDNVSDVGQILYTKAVLLNNNGADQTVLGPLSAAYFHGTTVKTTSPGVRVALLDPSTMLDTLANPPTVQTTQPANSGQVYVVPDPQSAQSNFVLSPGSDGNNNLDCTQAGINCKRTANIWWEGGGCNNTTGALGWDTTASNAPSPVCFNGTNTQKGMLSFPSAATLIQQATNHVSSAGTITVNYPLTTVAADLLVATVIVDTSRTVSGCTDGTNAYTQAVHVANGTIATDIWYFNASSTSMAAGSTLTCTFSAAGNAAIWFAEYNNILTSGMLDKTASSTGTSTSISSGTTAGTAQNTELVIMAAGSAGNVAATAQNGWNRHSSDASSTNVSINGQGLIQQATSTQSGTMTIGSSQAWAGAIATFKVASGGISQAQHMIVLPSYFLSSQPINAFMKWQTNQTPTGTVNVALFATITCSTDGNTDDNAFTNGVVINAPVPNTVAGSLTTTSFNNLPTSNGTGCSPGALMHLQVGRQRYAAADTYEGPVFMDGTTLQFGISR